MMTWVNLPASYLLSLLILTEHFYSTTFVTHSVAETWRQLWGGRILDERPKGDRLGAQRRAGEGVWGGGCAPSPTDFFIFTVKW